MRAVLNVVETLIENLVADVEQQFANLKMLLKLNQMNSS